jgi:hypothetical protein
MGGEPPTLNTYPKPVVKRWTKAARRQFLAERPWYRLAARAFAVALLVNVLLLISSMRNPEIIFFVGSYLILGAMVVAGRLAVGRIRRAIRLRLEADLCRGRFPYCIRCDYDLRGTSGEKCPECGASVLAVDWESEWSAASASADQAPDRKAGA